MRKRKGEETGHEADWDGGGFCLPKGPQSSRPGLNLGTAAWDMGAPVQTSTLPPYFFIKFFFSVVIKFF